MIGDARSQARLVLSSALNSVEEGDAQFPEHLSEEDIVSAFEAGDISVENLGEILESLNRSLVLMSVERNENDGELLEWAVMESEDDSDPTLIVGNSSILLTRPVRLAMAQALLELDAKPREDSKTLSERRDALVSYWHRHKVFGTATALMIALVLFSVIYGLVVGGSASIT